jgi:hypothetical protein
MPRLWKALCLALAVVALALFAISCGSGGTSYRIINAIANYDYQSTGGMDITMNGSLEFTGVQFTNINPPGKDAYKSVSSGSDALNVYAHGDSINGGLPFISTALSFSGRTQYTVLLMGNNTAQQFLYVAQPFTDNNAVPTTGDIEFRVIDASTNLGTQQLDVYIAGSVAVVTSGSVPANATIVYGQASPYVSVPAGTWWLVVTPHAGRTPILSASYSFPTPLSIHTIVLLDGQGGGGVGQPFLYNDLN